MPFRVNIDGRTVDLGEGRHLSLGGFARLIGGERSLNSALAQRLKHGAWFTGTLPVIVEDLRKVRNPGAHAERIEREVATRWRDRLVGVGCQGIFAELARVRRKT